MNEGNKVDPLRTALAAKGVEMSALFFVVFEHFELAGSPKRQPRLVAPPGPSTGGGKMSRQNITLTPIDNQPGPSVLVGWADSSTRRAELRSYHMVADTFRNRRGQDLDIPRGAYNKFLKQAEEFFREQEFTIVEVEQAPGRALVPQSAGWGLWFLVLVTTLLFGIAIGVAWMLWERGAF